MLGAKFLMPVYKWLTKKRSVAPASPHPARVHSLLMRLDESEGIQSFMARGIYEPEQTAWALECLSPGDRFVDIGANFGWYTALATNIVGGSGEVFAFEPSPVAADVIEKTIAENQLKNITLVRAAVGDAVGHVQIYMPQNNSVHSPSVLFSDPNLVPIQVPLISLDRYEPFADGQQIKLIKIDVEGFEPNVIRGMRELVQRGLIKNIFCEFNSGWLKHNAMTPSKLFDLIASYGFLVHKKTELQKGIDSQGDSYECQDIWFKWPN